MTSQARSAATWWLALAMVAAVGCTSAEAPPDDDSVREVPEIIDEPPDDDSSLTPTMFTLLPNGLRSLVPKRFALTEDEVPPDVPEGNGETEGRVASADCNALCEGMPSDAEYSSSDDERRQWAACFSCRCKLSLGWMPPPEELKCSTGDHLERYRFRTEPGAEGAPSVVTGIEVIDAEGDDTSGCLNGGIAVAGCDLKSRWKRMTNGNVEYQLLCRKPYAADDGYYEYLIIGNNADTGATCFWQSSNYNFNGEDTASLDVTDDALQPVEELVQKYVDTYYLYSAGPSTCTSCHGSDAFLWSPYFASAYPAPVADPLAMGRLAAPYFQVKADSERLQPVGHKFLKQGPVAAGEAPTDISCTGCHRIADDSTCTSFSRQALGTSYDAPTSDLNPQSAFDHGTGVVFWMPPGATSHGEYAKQTADDLARIEACCADWESDDSCVWSAEFQ